MYLDISTCSAGARVPSFHPGSLIMDVRPTAESLVPRQILLASCKVLWHAEVLSPFFATQQFCCRKGANLSENRHGGSPYCRIPFKILLHFIVFPVIFYFNPSSIRILYTGMNMDLLLIFRKDFTSIFFSEARNLY